MEKKYLKYKTKYFRKLMFGKGLGDPSEPSYSVQRIKMYDNILSEPYYEINKLKTSGDITSAFIQRIYNSSNSIFKVRFNLEEETQYIFENLDACLNAIKTAFDKNKLPKDDNKSDDNKSPKDDNKLPKSVFVNYEEKLLEGMIHLPNEVYNRVYYQPADTVYTVQETAGKSTSLKDVTDWESVKTKLTESINSDSKKRNDYELKI